MTTSKILTCLATAAMLTFGAAGLTFAQTTPAEFIAARKAGFKHIGENAEAIKKTVEAGGDVMPLAIKAKEVADWGRKVPSMFPVGSETGGDTKAKAEIWGNKADFDKLAGNLVIEAEKLAVLASAGDKAGFADQFKAMGGACGACHRVYRAR